MSLDRDQWIQSLLVLLRIIEILLRFGKTRNDMQVSFFLSSSCSSCSINSMGWDRFSEVLNQKSADCFPNRIIVPTIIWAQNKLENGPLLAHSKKDYRPKNLSFLVQEVGTLRFFCARQLQKLSNLSLPLASFL